MVLWVMVQVRRSGATAVSEMLVRNSTLLSLSLRANYITDRGENRRTFLDVRPTVSDTPFVAV